MTCKTRNGKYAKYEEIILNYIWENSPIYSGRKIQNHKKYCNSGELKDLAEERKIPLSSLYDVLKKLSASEILLVHKNQPTSFFAAEIYKKNTNFKPSSFQLSNAGIKYCRSIFGELHN
ncbi:MAG: hypothetical protein ACR2LL_07165 [Nitrosopumilus sp.]